ncbi:hypothetical protein LY78DRAFT_335778 [Colletotrichum sublineola]|nr:hypothetical protein LY78DRAFT_335778 [Colletotrichum sublineola]
MNDKIHRSRASSQRSTFLSYGRGMGISPFPPQSPPSVLDRSASGAPDPPVKVALDHAPGPGSVPIHHCIAHNFRAHDWIPHGEISFIWLSQHFQAINQPACSSVLSKWPGCCFACLPCFALTRASAPNKWSIHHFVFELPIPNTLLHPDHSRHPFCPRKR